MVRVTCNSKTCNYKIGGRCVGFLNELKIDATEFDNDSTAPPICISAENKEE